MSTSENEFSEKDGEQQSQEQGEHALPLSNLAEDPSLSEQTSYAGDIDSEGDLHESRPLTIQDLPPEAQGEAHGGPLGCCLGVMVGILLSLSIAIISRVYPDLFLTIFGEHISIIIRILMIIMLIAGAILFGVIGWRLGTRFYREYEPSPRYTRKMAELEARQRAIDRRRARRSRSGKNLSS